MVGRIVVVLVALFCCLVLVGCDLSRLQLPAATATPTPKPTVVATISLQGHDYQLMLGFSSQYNVPDYAATTTANTTNPQLDCKNGDAAIIAEQTPQGLTQTGQIAIVFCQKILFIYYQLMKYQSTTSVTPLPTGGTIPEDFDDQRNGLCVTLTLDVSSKTFTGGTMKSRPRTGCVF